MKLSTIRDHTPQGKTFFIKIFDKFSSL